MSKKYSTTQTLLIVESPAKCKKIEEFLGPSYKCIASFGHIRKLTSLEDIDMTNFEVNYKTMVQVDKIKKEILSSDQVIIATDNDREGEAIGWHICQVFGLNIEKTKRIVFQEITEKAIKEAMNHPVKINMNIVRAQQTRQILDLLVGFEISPLLWKYICSHSSKGLSAGRCQTPALKLIRDNKLDIELNTDKKVYKTIGYFNVHQWILPFELNKEIEKEEEIKDFLNKSILFSHTLTSNPPIKKLSSAPKPFTTSTLQQACSNEIHISPKETMKNCQSLYEKGYITYMRTDSKHYSNVFVEQASRFINNNWGDKYINNDFLNNTSTSSEAHEAIRPTNISLLDLELEKDISLKEKKIYKIIWQNTVESLMVSCSYHFIKANIPTCNNFIYTYSCEQILFPGWKIVKNNFDKENKEYYFFSTIKKEEQRVSYQKITSSLTLLQTKLHYTEAKIVQMLEEKGIGRPSTYASLVDKIQERDYVKKKDIKGKTIECKNFELEKDNWREIVIKKEFGNEKSKLILQPLGEVVLDFLDKYFSDIFSYEFTKQLENDLDLIASGSKDKVEVCKKYYDQLIFLKKKLEELKNEDGNEKENIKIDEKHTFIIGKYGPVIKCVDDKEKVSFKQIKKEVDIKRIQEYTLDELVVPLEKKEFKSKYQTGEIGEYQGKPLYIKKGKYGLYASWGTLTKSLKVLGNRPIENIGLEEVIKILEK